MKTFSTIVTSGHGRRARAGHRLPKVSLEPAKPFPSMPCGQPSLKLTAVSGVAVYRADSMRLSSTPLDTPRRMPLLQVKQKVPHDATACTQ